MTQPLTQTYDPLTYRSGTRQGITTGVFSSNQPHRAPVLCYIAGVECPVVSVSVTFGVWRIPEAHLTLFPDPTLQRFGADDRVPVVCFYLDEYQDAAAPTWRLLFEGEIVGWSYGNTAMGRSITFDCVGDISVYTQLFVFYMSTLNQLSKGALSQTPEQFNQAVAVYPYALFKRGLIADGRDTEFITRPFDLAYNIIRGLLTDKIPAQFRGVPAINFFTRWVRRQQFHNKWVALPYLDEQVDNQGKPNVDQPPGVFPILRAVQSQTAVDAVQEYTAQNTTGASIYEMLKNVLDTVFMELAMIPTAPLVSTDLGGNILGLPYITTQSGVYIPQSAGPMSAKKPLRLASYFIKPQFLFGLPPTCNVLFPSMITQFTYSENYATQPTRLYFQDEALAAMFGAKTEDQATYLLTVLSRAYPPEADYKYQEYLGQKGRGAENGKNILLYPDEFFKGPVTSRYPAPRWLMYLAMQYQAKGKEASVPNEKAATPEIKGSITESDVYRMYAQYEFFRQKYATRGGAIECAFQPYVIPGFPLMAFDNVLTKMHVMGYLINVTHELSPGNARTSLNYSFGRTIYEFFADVAQEIDAPTVTERAGMATAAAPPEPIKEIRDIIQHFSKADAFYQKLFLRQGALSQEERAVSTEKKGVFEYRDMLAFANSDGTLDDIFIEGRNEEALSRDTARIDTYIANLEAYQADTVKQLLFPRLFSQGLTTDGVSNAEPYLEAVVIAESLRERDTYDLAMFPQNFLASMSLTAKKELLDIPGDNPLELVTVKSALTYWQSYKAFLATPQTHHNLDTLRPVVPKPGYEEYFDSYDAAMRYCSRPICTLEEYIAFIGGIREGVNDELGYGTVQGVPSARYYTRIRDLKGMTDSAIPSREQQGLKGVQPEAVAATFPDMRADWQKVLLAYRRNVYDVTKVSR